MEFLTPALKNALIAVFSFLFISHCLVLLIANIKKGKDFSNLKLRMKSWWVILSFLLLIFLTNKLIALITIGIMSALSLKEFLSFINFEKEDKSIILWMYLSIPLQIYFLYSDWMIMFYLFVPLYMFLILPLRRMFTGRVENFIKVTSAAQWGILLNVYALGYLGAFLFIKTDTIKGAELLLFLLLINTLNDAFQYIWGKLFGKNKIVPKISPNKTWEGFIGGMITTVLLSVTIAPYLTPMDLKFSILAGLLISVFGFFGDVVLSAVKRDAKVKDSSNLIPGHGGILDRVDSLTYTAPLFFHFICYFFL